MGKADGPAQQTNLGKRSVMVGLGLMSEGEGNRKNTTILSDGEWTGIVTAHCILHCLHVGIYNDQWPNLSWVLVARMGTEGGRHNKISHQLTSGTSLWWLSWRVSLGSLQSAKIRLLQMVIQSRSLMQVLSVTSRGEFLPPSAAAGSCSGKAASITFLSSHAENAPLFIDGYASPFLPCSNPVEKIKFLRTVSSLKLWFYFVIMVLLLRLNLTFRSGHGFAFAKAEKSQWGSVRSAGDQTRWIQFQCSGFNVSILQWDGIINHR